MYIVLFDQQMQTFPRIILSKIKEADYVHKVFLKPLEVELKTNR